MDVVTTGKVYVAVGYTMIGILQLTIFAQRQRICSLLYV